MEATFTLLPLPLPSGAPPRCRGDVLYLAVLAKSKFCPTSNRTFRCQSKQLSNQKRLSDWLPLCSASVLSRRELVQSTAALLPLLLSLHPSKAHSATVESLPNLRPYVDEADNYELSYPAEWEQDRLVELHSPKSGAASPRKTSVAFHNVMDPFENVSVVVSPLGNNGPPSLRSLGDPDRVASGLLRNVIANPNTSDRTAQLVSASSWQDAGSVEYYLFEFRVQSERWRRHNIASLTIANNKLYTLTVQVPESRWEVLESDARAVARSFHIRS